LSLLPRAAASLPQLPTLPLWSKPSRISHSLLLHDEDITTFHIVMVLENCYGGQCAKYQSEDGSTPSSEMFKPWTRVESLTHCLFCQPAPPVASMASYCGTSFFHCLLIYYQNFCADAARICREFHCMYTSYICNFMTLLDGKKSVHIV